CSCPATFKQHTHTHTHTHTNTNTFSHKNALTNKTSLMYKAETFPPPKHTRCRPPLAGAVCGTWSCGWVCVCVCVCLCVCVCVGREGQLWQANYKEPNASRSPILALLKKKVDVSPVRH